MQECDIPNDKQTIRGFISKERRIRRDLQNAIGGDPAELIDKKWLIRLLYKPIEDARGISPEQLSAIYASYPFAESILSIVRDFKLLLRAKKQDALPMWMEKAAALEISELDTFVNDLKQDIDAVVNAIASDFSNGLAEATINKIKVIKRIMYGRCSFNLPKSKCSLAQSFN